MMIECNQINHLSTENFACPGSSVFLVAAETMTASACPLRIRCDGGLHSKLSLVPVFLRSTKMNVYCGVMLAAENEKSLSTMAKGQKST